MNITPSIPSSMSLLNQKLFDRELNRYVALNHDAVVLLSLCNEGKTIHEIYEALKHDNDQITLSTILNALNELNRNYYVNVKTSYLNKLILRYMDFTQDGNLKSFLYHRYSVNHNSVLSVILIFLIIPLFTQFLLLKVALLLISLISLSFLPLFFSVCLFSFVTGCHELGHYLAYRFYANGKTNIYS